MKIRSIKATDILPIKKLEIKELGDIVIIAGANGSGKTRLKDAIISTFQNFNSPLLDLDLESTRKIEVDRWGFTKVSVKKGLSYPTLEQYMTSRTRGGSYTGSVIHIDSQRSVTSIQFRVPTFTTIDPADQEIDFRTYLTTLNSRWNELVNQIYDRVSTRKIKIADYIISNPNATDALRKFPDPFKPYQKLFAKLLIGKKLLPIDPKQQQEFRYITSSGAELPFSSLSSGEQEVVKITFDILARTMEHCIFLIDEPELHLHPTLTFRLIETLKDIGKGTNQFIFFTHSADLISTYYSTGNVFFIESVRRTGNQAHKLSKLDSNHSNVVQLMSKNLGLFAVGKKLIFVEGEDSSRDRLTYHTIAQEFFPEANIIPIGSVSRLMKLKDISKELDHTIFGIKFFMIRDRDGLNDSQVSNLESGRRLFCLKRRHLENYFLDSEILSKVAINLSLSNHWHNSSTIEGQLKKIANSSLKHAVVLNMKEFVHTHDNIDTPNIISIDSKTLPQITDEFVTQVNDVIRSVESTLNETELKREFVSQEMILTASLADDKWKNVFPGKVIFNSFCGKDGFKIDSNLIRSEYVKIALKEKPEVFQDVIEIMQTFKAQ